MAGQTTKAERDARRKLVYHKHFVLGMSARRIADEPDIDADHATVARDIKALKASTDTPDKEWYINKLMDIVGTAGTSDQLKAIGLMLKVAPVLTAEEDPDFDAWNFDTRPKS